jgi:hypothetical protein
MEERERQRGERDGKETRWLQTTVERDKEDRETKGYTRKRETSRREKKERDIENKRDRCTATIGSA